MNKAQIDELYHLLREASNSMNKAIIDSVTGLTAGEEGDIIMGLSRHLLGGGDYPALVRFC